MAIDLSRDSLLQDITLAVIARNEAANLPRFFEAAAWAQHVVLYDDGSTDATAAMARARGAAVVAPDPGCGDFAAKRNRLQREVETKWVLWLDADEAISAADMDRVVSVLAQRPAVSGFRFRMHNYFLGRRMRGRAWTRWRGLRLAMTERSRWQGAVHERLIVEGPVEQLETPILHFGDQTYRRRANKSLHYNLLEVGRMGRRPGFAEVLLRPLYEFVKYYVLHYGFIDGKPGLIFGLHVCAAWFQRLAIAHTEQGEAGPPSRAVT